MFQGSPWDFGIAGIFLLHLFMVECTSLSRVWSGRSRKIAKHLCFVLNSARLLAVVNKLYSCLSFCMICYPCNKRLLTAFPDNRAVDLWLRDKVLPAGVSPSEFMVKEDAALCVG